MPISPLTPMGRIAVLGTAPSPLWRQALAVSPANQIGFWRINEPSGVVAADLSAQANHGAYTGVALANAAGPDGVFVPYFDGSGNCINLYSAAFRSDFNGQEGSFSGWFKVNSIADWGDGVLRRVAYFSVDANNYWEIYKHATSMNLFIQYRANNVAKTPTIGNVAPSKWTHIGLKWSYSGDFVTSYLNGVLIKTYTGLGAWSGALYSRTAVLGNASSYAPQFGSEWHGWLGLPGMWNTPLSDAQFQKLAGRNWRGFEGLLITFDDGRANMYGGFDYMRDRGLMGTQYVVTDLTDTANYLTHEQLQEMDGAGWIIGNHTKDHTILTTLTEAQQETELTGAKTALEGWGLTRGSLHVAYPGGGSNADTITAMTNTGMLTGRNTEVTATIDPLAAYPYQIGIASIGITNTTTLADVQALINTARTRGKYVALLFHGLVDAAPAAWEWTNANFQALVDWIIAQGIPTKTIEDFYAAR